MPVVQSHRGGNLRRWICVVGGLGIAGVLGVLAFRKVDWSVALLAMRAADWGSLALVPTLLACAPLLRAARWRVVLGDMSRATLPNLVSAAGIGPAANCVLPGKLGEAFSAHALGRVLGESRVQTLGVLVVTRIADALVLFALVVLGTLVFRDAIPASIRVAGWSVAAVCAASLALLLVARASLSANGKRKLTELARARLGDRVFAFVQQLMQGIFVFRNAGELAGFVAYTVLLWLTIAGAFWVGASAFHIPLAPHLAPMLMAVAAVGTMVPSAPGNVGTYHFFGVLALGLVGVDRDTAAASIITYHALDVTTSLVVGAICLVAVRSTVWSFWSPAAHAARE